VGSTGSIPREQRRRAKGDTKRALARERSGGTLRSGRRSLIRPRETVDIYILYIIYAPDLGIGDYSFLCGKGSIVAWEEHGGSTGGARGEH
jgi:hypothetical protein